MSNITSASYPVITVSKAGDQFVVVQNGQLKKLTRDGLAAFIDGLAPDTVLELTDTPASYVGQQGKVLVVNPTEDGMVFEAATSGNFLALSDTPVTYGGNATKLAVVTADETALEFIDNALIRLIDTPSSYTGASEQLLRVNTGATGVEFIDRSDIQTSGWASYIDTGFPDAGTPFTLSAATDTQLPNNAGTVIDFQKPADVTTFYDGNVITGRNGDNLDIMLYFKAVPSAVGQFLDIWIDIGGSVGELYRQTFSFPKGAGVERGVLYSLSSAYTLDTWEANGGTVFLRSDASMDIYDINFNFDRSHKAK